MHRLVEASVFIRFGFATHRDVAGMLLACTQVCPCCTQPTSRDLDGSLDKKNWDLDGNKFSGSIGALGKLTKLTRLSVCFGGIMCPFVGIGSN